MASSPISGPEPASAGLRVRGLRRRDLPSFEKVLLQGVGALERGIGLAETAAEMSRSLRRPLVWALFTLLRALGRTIRIFVAVDSTGVRGTASVILYPRAGVVVGVATDAAARGHGIATRLMEEVRRLAERKRRAGLLLDVETDNEPALRLYRRLGYAERARFAWYTGPTPESTPENGDGIAEVPRASLATVAAWVDQHRSSGLAQLLPATPRRLSHLELLFRMPRSSSRTWELTTSKGRAGVVRGYYSPGNQTGYVLPAAWDPELPLEALRSLAAAAISWADGLGAVRSVVVVPDGESLWAATLEGLGLSPVVTTLTMVRTLSG
jgi:GNAT superfamily N-acetyltransferase